MPTGVEDGDHHRDARQFRAAGPQEGQREQNLKNPERDVRRFARSSGWDRFRVTYGHRNSPFVRLMGRLSITLKIRVIYVVRFPIFCTICKMRIGQEKRREYRYMIGR